MAIEFWAMGRPNAGGPNSQEFNAVRQAVRAEEIGYDGIVYVDSQNRYGDTYVAMALAAHATSTVKLGTGVTNSHTRHPAVTASAIATVQVESGGRAYLGIGRGDSALAHLGRAPDSVPKFENYLDRLQGYLRGEEVPFESGGDIDSIGLADYKDSSLIFWIDEVRPPKVQVRTRYNQGQHEDNPRSNETTATVSSPPTPAAGPTPIAEPTQEPAPEPMEEPTPEPAIGGWPLPRGIQEFG